MFYEKEQKLLLTGSSNEYTSRAEGPTVDNIFMINSLNASSKGLAAAQANCGPKIRIDRQISEGISFGDIGSMFISGLNQYRIETVNFTDSSVSLTASASLTINEWNQIWTGLTFQDFNDIVLDPALFPNEALKFNEFTIIPRIGA